MLGALSGVSFSSFFYPITLIFDYLLISEHRTRTRTSGADIMVLVPTD
jgi:hypothetical protein